MIAGIDVGFGWTKVVTDDKIFKFPSWLANYISADISEVATVKYGDRMFVVGRDVKYMSQKIEIPTITELVKYFPVFIKYTETLTGKLEKIVTGVPVKYKDHKEELESIIRDLGINCEVVPQGFGIFMDVKEKLHRKEVLVLDIGYNTFDYLILTKKDDDTGWKKTRGKTIDRLGIIKAVETFRDSLPTDFSYAKNYSFSRLLEIFERGTLMFDGEEIDLNNIKQQALAKYGELIISRMKEEMGEDFTEMDEVIFAGGGANLVKLNIFRCAKTHIPEQPEFSQARGYLKYALGDSEF